MHNRETKTKANNKSNQPVPYEPDSFRDYVEEFTSETASAATAILFVPALIAHFDRSRSSINHDTAEQIMEAAMNFFENEADDLTDAQCVDLVHLSALALLEMDESSAGLFDQWAGAVLKWLARNKDVRNNADYADRISSCIALVEITFRPTVLIDVRSSISCFGHLVRVIDATQDAKSRGIFVELAAQVARDPMDPFSPASRGVSRGPSMQELPAGAAAGGDEDKSENAAVAASAAASAFKDGGEGGTFPKKSIDAESVVAARFIKAAIEAPAEDLIIHGIKAAAIFFDRFGGDGGLDPEVLGIGADADDDDEAAAEIPTAAQKKLGVNKTNVEKACKAEFAYIKSDQEERHSEKLSDDIDLTVDRFDRLYLLRCINQVYLSGPATCLQRTDRGIYRIAVLGLNWQKPWRDRAFGIGKFAEQYLQKQDKKRNDKLRDKDRKTRHMLDAAGPREE